MTEGLPSNLPTDATGALAKPAGAPRRTAAPMQRNTVRDTWRWLWKDALGRVTPCLMAAGAYAYVSHQGPAALGLSATGWWRPLGLGVLLGIPMAGVAAGFRAWSAPGYRLPTLPDQVVQTAYYLLLNAPAEELFWRGTAQTLAIRGLAALPGPRPLAGVVGWAAVTAVFGAYHRLGGWSWRMIAGVTVAGGFFGLLYLWQPGQPSILLPIGVHALATTGFLNWGDVWLHWRRVRGRRERATGSRG
jgi:membrane protease YdiL (CAAX protease family)